jgi:hypothetical protein
VSLEGTYPVKRPSLIVGHLAPDLDCLVAMWQLVRFGGAKHATFAFVPAGATTISRSTLTPGLCMSIPAVVASTIISTTIKR